MTAMDMETGTGQAAVTPLHPLLAARRSTRAFDETHEVAPALLDSLLEAARWAPSASNTQPWRFVAARRGSPSFDRLFATLAPGNQAWAGAASALVLAVAQVCDEHGAPRTFAHYDLGQSVAHLTVQAQAQGLDVHQMGGFDAGRARAAFGLDENLQPLVVVAVGSHAPELVLPEPLAARERAPRDRHPLSALVLDPAHDEQELPRTA